jgi:hypothetical protein
MRLPDSVGILHYLACDIGDILGRSTQRISRGRSLAKLPYHRNDGKASRFGRFMLSHIANEDHPVIA